MTDEPKPAARLEAASTRRDKIDVLLASEGPWLQPSWEWHGFRAVAALTLAVLEVADAIKMAALTEAEKKP